MVKLLLALALFAVQARAEDTQADPVAAGGSHISDHVAASPAASPEAASLDKFTPEPNSPFEDFFTVSLVSLPFTTLWSFVGATTVAAISQQKFPPEYNDQLLIGAGSTALGLSLGIGLFSISWGEGRAPAVPLSKGTLP